MDRFNDVSSSVEPVRALGFDRFPGEVIQSRLRIGRKPCKRKDCSRARKRHPLALHMRRHQVHARRAGIAGRAVVLGAVVCVVIVVATTAGALVPGGSR